VPVADRAEAKMIPYYHDYGENPCGEIAFWFNTETKADPEEIVYSSDIYFDDGTHPETGSIPICQKCGRIVHLRMAGFRGGES